MRHTSRARGSNEVFYSKNSCIFQVLNLLVCWGTRYLLLGSYGTEVNSQGQLTEENPALTWLCSLTALRELSSISLGKH